MSNEMRDIVVQIHKVEEILWIYEHNVTPVYIASEPSTRFTMDRFDNYLATKGSSRFPYTSTRLLQVTKHQL